MVVLHLSDNEVVKLIDDIRGCDEVGLPPALQALLAALDNAKFNNPVRLNWAPAIADAQEHILAMAKTVEERKANAERLTRDGHAASAAYELRQVDYLERAICKAKLEIEEMRNGV